MNSDPAMIQLFLRWLRLLSVDNERLQYRVSIHESADQPAALAFWARVAGVEERVFDRTNLKRHNPVTEPMALDWAASRDENRRRAWLSSFLPGAHEPESQIDARGLPGTSNCCPVHAS